MSSSSLWKHQFVETKVMPPAELAEYLGRPTIRWEGEGSRIIIVSFVSSNDPTITKEKEEEEEEEEEKEEEEEEYDKDGAYSSSSHQFRLRIIGFGGYESRGYDELEFRATDFKPFIVDWLITRAKKLFIFVEDRGRHRRGGVIPGAVKVKYIGDRDDDVRIECVKIPTAKINVGANNNNIPTQLIAKGSQIRPRKILGRKVSFLIYEPNVVFNIRSFFQNEDTPHYINHNLRRDCTEKVGGRLQRWKEYANLHHPILVNTEIDSISLSSQCPTCLKRLGSEITLIPYNYNNDRNRIILKTDSGGYDNDDDDDDDEYRYASHNCS